MPLLQRKKVIRLAVEAVEGNTSSAVTPAMSDAILALGNPTYRSDQSMVERESVQVSLDTEFANPGKSFERVAFEFDLRNQGDTDADTQSRLGRLLLCSGTIQIRTCILATNLEGVQPGDILEGATSGALAVVVSPLSVGVGYVVERLNSIAFATTENISVNGEDITEGVGVTSNSTIEQRYGFLYRPVSRIIKTVALTAGAWTGGTPGNGVVLQGATSGAVGVVRNPTTIQGYPVQLPAAESTVATPAAPTALTTSETVLYYEPVKGTFLPGEALNNLSSETNNVKTVHGTPAHAYVQNASATIRFNIDGIDYGTAGARGTGRVDLRNGEPSRVSFEFMGKFERAQDQALSGNPDYGDTANVLRVANWRHNFFPWGEASFDMGNGLIMRPEPEQADGSAGAMVTTRMPVLEIDPELAPTAVASEHWRQLKRDATSGLAHNKKWFDSASSAGNRFALVCGNLQVMDENDEARDEIATKKLRLHARRDAAWGDDSYWFLLI